MKIYYNPRHDFIGLNVEGVLLKVVLGNKCRTFMVLTPEWELMGES